MRLKSFVAILVISWLMVGVASAQEAGSITFKFHIDEAAFANVTNSAELVQALRQTTRIDMGISMDSQLWVDIRGYAGDPTTGGQLGHLLLPSIRVALKGNQSIEDFSWAEAVVESHGDDFPDDGDRWDEQEVEGWTEDEAWAALTRSIDGGLPGSASEFGRLADDEHQPLKVSEVEVRSFEFSGTDDPRDADSIMQCCYQEHGIEGPVIVLKPELRWDTGRFPSDGDIDYRVDALVIHVEATGAPAPPPAPEAEEVATGLGRRCLSMLAAGGAAELTIDGATVEGGAVYRRGPNGEILVAVGAFQDSTPAWCFTLASAEPVEDQGSYAVIDPGTAMQTRKSMTAVYQDVDSPPTLFWSTSGEARLRIGEIAEGRLQLQGLYRDGDGEPREVEVSGWFEAKLLE